MLTGQCIHSTEVIIPIVRALKRSMIEITQLSANFDMYMLEELAFGTNMGRFYIQCSVY